MQEAVDQPSREDEIKLRLALRAAQIGIWDWSLDTDEMVFSARARAIFGFTTEQPVTLEALRRTTHPDDRPYAADLARRALDPNVRERAPYEYRILKADTGEVRWILAHGEAVFAESEAGLRAIRYIGTVQDITERKKVEQALRDSESRQRLAIDAARMAVWELHVPTDQITTSPELNRMFGLPDDARPTIAELRACYGPGERENLQRAAMSALERGERHFEAEFRCRRPDGNLHWLLLRAEVIMAADGSFERVVGVLMDIDERKRSEERQMLLLRELNHRVKNSLSVVQSLATQTFRDGSATPGALSAFRDRLQALAKANDVLLDKNWASFSLTALVNQIVEPYRDPYNRFRLEGDDIDLPPRTNVPVALILHELCTNAAKYGALSVEDGYVRIEWRQVPKGTEITWSEHGGPEVQLPLAQGFGTRLISAILGIEVGEVQFDPDPSGIRCRLLVTGKA